MDNIVDNVVHADQLNFVHTGQLNVVHARQLNVVHGGQLNVVHAGQLNVVHAGQLNVVHAGQLNVVQPCQQAIAVLCVFTYTHMGKIIMLFTNWRSLFFRGFRYQAFNRIRIYRAIFMHWLCEYIFFSFKIVFKIHQGRVYTGELRRGLHRTRLM